MQESSTFPHWVQTAFGWLASGIAGGAIVRAYAIWLTRRKPAAEIHVTEATAAEITVRASSSASDAVMRMMDRLTAAQGQIDRLRQERDAWQDEYDKAFTERDEMIRCNGLLRAEVDNYENQMKTMRATLAENNVNYDNTQNAKPSDYTLPVKT